MNNLCNNKEQDYFVIESMTDNAGEGLTVETLKELGMTVDLLFRNDGTVRFTMGAPINGTWNSEKNTITVGPDDEPGEFPFTVEGDLLFLEINDETYTFRRSDDAPAEPVSGGTVEIAITDGFAIGRMSVTCPDGWYYHEQTMFESMMMFGISPQMNSDLPSITVQYSIKEAAEESNEEQMVGIFGDSAVTIKGVSDNLMQQIMDSVQIVWDTPQSNLAICEGKEEEFFKMRSMITGNGQVANHTLLEQFGYDWCILFRKDGTVRAKFDGSVTCTWGVDFGETVKGTWNNEAMTFINGEQTHVVPFTLEGDIISVKLDGSDFTFRRSDDAMPEILL